ncbi:MAG: 50S ribosomal protein L16 [Candidatus Thorarchaeota archaeon]|nr:MAG: 50S ribosomal protein L16 [Candidatus Thorarchaeota archaeon]
MGKRPGRCYRECDRPAFMRTRYIHRQPASKIASFDMGAPELDFEVEMSLVGTERCQIRNQALEAARVAANRYLTKILPRQKFHLRVRVKPYQWLRENKMVTGAGADRVQDGMRKAWGKVIGSAARIRPGQAVITVRVDRGQIDVARVALEKAAPKIPTPCRIVFDKIDPELRRKLGYGAE